MTFDPTFSISDVVTAFMALMSAGAVMATLYVFRKNQEPRIAVFLDSDTDAGTISLVVRNDGSSAARNVKLPAFDWEMVQPEDLPIVKECFISKGIPMLAPGCERRTLLCSSRYASQNLLGKEAVQHVDYERRTWRGGWAHCWDDFTLDYYSFAHSVYTKSDGHLSRVAVERMEAESKRQSASLDAIAACANELGALAATANDALDAAARPSGSREMLVKG